MIEKNLKISKGEAKVQARKNMLGLIKIVNFDGRSVGEIMNDDPLTQRRVETLVGSAYQQGEIEYLEKQEVAIALAVKMSGLAEILVDAGGHLNEGLSQPTYLMTRNLLQNLKEYPVLLLMLEISIIYLLWFLKFLTKRTN